MLNIIKKHERRYAMAGLILALSFLLNAFEIGPNALWFGNFQQDAEKVALTAADCTARGAYRGGVVTPAPALSPSTKVSPMPIKDAAGCQVDPSRFGLQGYIYGGISSLNKTEAGKKMLGDTGRFALAILLAILLVLFIAFVHAQFGGAAAAATWALLLLSDWPTAFARNLYWMTFLFFAPFIFSLFVYPRVRESVRGRWSFLAGLAGLFTVKFLCGYEFFTVVAASAAVPVVYWEASRGAGKKAIAKKCAPVLGAAMMALAAAASIHVASLSNDYASRDEAIAAIIQSHDRGDATDSFAAVVPNLIATNPNIAAKANGVLTLERYSDGIGLFIIYYLLIAVTYLFIPVISLPFVLKGSTLLSVLGSFAAWAWFGWWCVGYLQRRRVVEPEKLRALRLSIIAAAAGALTWPIVAGGHFMRHADFGALILYLPLMPLIYVAVALAVIHGSTAAWRRWIKKVDRAAE